MGKAENDKWRLIKKRRKWDRYYSQKRVTYFIHDKKIFSEKLYEKHNKKPMARALKANKWKKMKLLGLYVYLIIDTLFKKCDITFKHRQTLSNTLMNKRYWWIVHHSQ